jgi:hypothetical protein
MTGRYQPRSAISEQHSGRAWLTRRAGRREQALKKVNIRVG